MILQKKCCFIAFNGNDAIALAKNGTIIDVVGVIGSADDFGKDVTLIRKSTVTSGNTTFTLSEWTVKGANYTNTLGSWGDPAGFSPEGNYSAADYTTTVPTLDGGLAALRAGGATNGLTTTVTGVICSVQDNTKFWIQDKDTALYAYNVALQTPPVVGDEVSFEVTTVGAFHELLQITGITASSDSVQSSGNKPYVQEFTDVSAAFAIADLGKLVRYTGSLASSSTFTSTGLFKINASGGADFSATRTGTWVGPIGRYDADIQLYVNGIDTFQMD